MLWPLKFSVLCKLQLFLRHFSSYLFVVAVERQTGIGGQERRVMACSKGPELDPTGPGVLWLCGMRCNSNQCATAAAYKEAVVASLCLKMLL